MSSALAKQYHSITIGDRNTWDDWHLIPTSRPVFSPPQANIILVDVPGANGSLNLTKSMTGYTTYKNRTGSFEFIVSPDYIRGNSSFSDIDESKLWGSWFDAYHEIASYLHGEEYRAILDDDPGYYYDCVWTIGEWKSGPKWTTITIGYSAQPFKKSIQNLSEPWLWDPFSFSQGYINDFQEFDPSTKTLEPIVVNSGDTLSINIVGGDEPISPVINVGTIPEGAFFQVQHNGGTLYQLTTGKNRMRKIKMTGKNNLLEFGGAGVLLGIEYEAGWL